MIIHQVIVLTHMNDGIQLTIVFIVIMRDNLHVANFAIHTVKHVLVVVHEAIYNKYGKLIKKF